MPEVSWLFFKARAKHPYLSHTGRASNAEKQPTGPGPEGCDGKWAAAALLVGHDTIRTLLERYAPLVASRTARTAIRRGILKALRINHWASGRNFPAGFSIPSGILLDSSSNAELISFVSGMFGTASSINSAISAREPFLEAIQVSPLCW